MGIMDVNSTIVLTDIMSGKDKASVILSAMFEFIFLEPTRSFELVIDPGTGWPSGSCKVPASKVTLKTIIKKALDKKAYQAFWTYPAARRVIQQLEAYGLLYGDRPMTVDDFEARYSHYIALIERSLQSGGIIRSWFELVGQHTGRDLLMLNTYGIDSRKVVAESISGNGEEVDSTVTFINYGDWSARDKDHFEKTFLNGKRKATVLPHNGSGPITSM